MVVGGICACRTRSNQHDRLHTVLHHWGGAWWWGGYVPVGLEAINMTDCTLCYTAGVGHGGGGICACRTRSNQHDGLHVMLHHWGGGGVTMTITDCMLCHITDGVICACRTRSNQCDRLHVMLLGGGVICACRTRSNQHDRLHIMLHHWQCHLCLLGWDTWQTAHYMTWLIV